MPAATELLKQERAAREAAERKVLALTAEKRVLEHRVINAHRTLAYGLGRALIEARSVKGLLALPGRMHQLWLKQKAKRREQVPDSFAGDVALTLQLVDPAVDRAIRDGISAALDWVSVQSAPSAAKARALAELAHWVLDENPEQASRAGLDAAALEPGDQRLFSLAVRLRNAGLVAVPAKLCAAFRDHLVLSEAQRRLCDYLEEDAATLDRGAWELAQRKENEAIARGPKLAIICSHRWRALPQIAEAQAAAMSAGLSVSVLAFPDDIDFSDFPVVHVFADSLSMACSIAVDARAAGCQLIVDLANPPTAMLSFPESECAKVEALRLAGLGTGSDFLVTRSRSMASRLEDQNIDHRIANEDIGMVEYTVGYQAITGALAEFGARSGATTIGCIATLDNDPGLFACLESFGGIAAADEDAQLLVIGGGNGFAALARKAVHLGVDDRVHFVGQPPPQRWPALLAALDLAIFPRLRDEALGSEVSALLLVAIRLGRPILATEAAWNAQVVGDPDAVSILPEGDSWTDNLRQHLVGGDNEFAVRAQSGKSIGKIYKIVSKAL